MCSCSGIVLPRFSSSLIVVGGLVGVALLGVMALVAMLLVVVVVVVVAAFVFLLCSV